MRLAAIVLALVLMFTPAAFAQRGGRGGSRGGSRGGTSHGPVIQRGGSPRGGGYSPRYSGPHAINRPGNYDRNRFGRENSFRFDRRDSRFFRGRGWGYPYGGLWFYYRQPWPFWFDSCEVYFEMGPDGLWYARCIHDPRLFIEVYPY